MGTIGWSMSGEGRGHASRNLMLMLEMARRGHKIDVYTSLDSHEALSTYFKAHPNDRITLNKIPGFILAYDKKGRIHIQHSISRNVIPMIRTLRGFNALVRRVRRKKYDLHIMDFEPYFSRAVKQAKLSGPQIQVSSAQAAIAYCKLDLPIAMTATQYAFMKGFMRGYQPKPNQLLLTTFFKPDRLPPFAKFCGPIVRREVQTARRTKEGFILVYIKPLIERVMFPIVDEVAARTGQKFIVYVDNPAAHPRHARSVTLKKSALGGDFLRDFARCNAVIGTGGTELATEAAWLEKPLLAVMQTYQYEQYVSGHYVKKCGIGHAVESVNLSQAVITNFIKRIPVYAKSVKQHKKTIPWGNKTIPKILESYME